MTDDARFVGRDISEIRFHRVCRKSCQWVEWSILVSIFFLPPTYGKVLSLNMPLFRSGGQQVVASYISDAMLEAHRK